MEEQVIMQATKGAFHFVTSILRQYAIPFQLTGGLAARWYGSKRPLCDIDFDVPEEKFELLAALFKDYITFGPARSQE